MQLSSNKLLAAISDATPDDDRSFLFPWKPEEQKRLTKLMSEMAEAELASGHEGDTTAAGTKARLPHVGNKRGQAVVVKAQPVDERAGFGLQGGDADDLWVGEVSVAP